MSLTREAIEEGVAKARQQVRDQADILKLSKKMPDGFKMANQSQQQRIRAGGINISVDRSMEIAPGGYQAAEED